MSGEKYASWCESPRTKLFEDGYRRQLKSALLQSAHRSELETKELKECSFRPALAPGSMNLERKTEEKNVFRRLNADADRAKRKKELERSLVEQDLREKEKSELPFRPTINSDTSFPESVASYCALPVAERLFRPHTRPSPLPTEVAPRRRFSATAAERLATSRPSLKSQTRELKARMVEDDVCTFKPTTNRWIPPSTFAAPLAEEDIAPSSSRSNASDSEVLKASEYLARREFWLEKRQERLRSGVTAREPCVGDWETPVSLRLPLTELAAAAARLNADTLECQSEGKLDGIRQQIEEERLQPTRELRQASDRFYQQLRAQGLYDAGAVPIPRRKVPTKRPGMPKVVEEPVKRGTVHLDPAIVALEERASAKLAQRLQTARERKGTVPVKPLPQVPLCDPEVAIKGFEDYQRRVAAAKELAKRNEAFRQACFRPKPTAVCRRRTEDSRLLTVVSPFSGVEQHCRDSQAHAETQRAVYRREVEENVCRFRPVICPY